MTPFQIVFVVYPGIALLDLAGPLQAMTWARWLETGTLGYNTAIVSKSGGSVLTDTFLSVDTEPMADWENKGIDTLLVVGGDGVYDAADDAETVAGLRTLAARSKRVCSVCSGAYLLAAIGLLDRRRAVTHWEDATRLGARFPNVRLELDPIYVKDDHIWTSAGVTAGIDMALALVVEDMGPKVALDRAQSLVTYMVRPGGQSQFSAVLERQRRDRTGRFENLHRWISDNLDQDLRVEQLAEHENMSLRNFHRLYVSTTGVTPAKAVGTVRMERAREMLETSQASIKTIASRCGFKGEDRMRRAFVRGLGVSPGEYRQRFQIAAGTKRSVGKV